MSNRVALPLALLSLTVPATAGATEVSADLVLGFRRFEQQVKVEIGGERGERLVEETELSIGLNGGVQVWRWFSVGAFLRWDIGSRTAARFAGTDAEGRTIVEDEVGGAFNELWLGPLVMAKFDWFRLNLGYGLFGARQDDARDDLAGDGVLRTSPTVAWSASVGAQIPVWQNFSPVFFLEYRVRYYDRRKDPLPDGAVHGTQNFTPLLGVAFHYD